MLTEYCQQYNINENIILNNTQWQDNDDKRTFSIYLAYNKIIPPEQYKHDNRIKDIYGFTVSMYLYLNKKQIPNYWKYYPYHNKYNENDIEQNKLSFFMNENKQIGESIQIKYPIQDIQQTKYKVNKELNLTGIQDWNIIRQLYNYCIYYDINHDVIINDPSWQDNKDQLTFSMFLSVNKIIPQQYWNHKPDLQDIDGNTVAMLLAYNKIIPPKEWEHDSKIQNNYQDNVALLLEVNNIEVPEQWRYNPEYRLQNDYTTAMYLLKYKKDIQQYWNHDPLLINKYGQTVSMIYAEQNIIPPKQWEHNPNIVDSKERTVQDYLEQNNIDIPEQWKVINRDIQIDKIMKSYLRIYCIRQGIKNQQIVINNPGGQTYNYKFTFSMWLAYKGIMPPQEFEHDPLLKDDNGNTVAILLSSQGIIPPQQWMHDVDMINKQGESIRLNLLFSGYIYENNEFIKLTQDTVQQYIQTEILNDTCQICLQEGQQYFIKSTCTHKVCINCFLEMMNIQKHKKCPVCIKQYWFKLVEQKQQ